jgi:hypothetical protein
MVESLAITRAAFTRRFSRIENSSTSSPSIASSGLSSPRSSWRTVASIISSARGILRPTRVCLMRSGTEPLGSARAVMTAAP